MARYDFKCDECGTVFEVGGDLKPLLEDGIAICPHGEDDPDRELPCMSNSFTRIYHAPAVHYRADGFYSTRDDPGGIFQAERRAKRARARKNNQAPPEGERYG